MTKLKKEVYIPMILLISAFSPYISPTSSIKGDIICIYLFFLYSLLIVVKRKKVSKNRNIINLLVVWTMLFIFLLFRTLLFGGNLSTYSLIAEIKNFSQPLIIIFIFMTLNYKNLNIDSSGEILLVLLSINTVWIFLNFFIDMKFIGVYFERGVANNAIANQRFSGIFNQPMESGIAYSMGLLMWVYLFAKNKIEISVKFFLILGLIIIGGYMSVSKIFIFIGMTLFILSLFSERKKVLKPNKVYLILIPIIILIINFLIKKWDELFYIGRLFKLSNYKEQGFLPLITAGRFGGETSQQSIFFKNILEKHPLIGTGMGSQEMYDSGFFHFFSSGGIIALGFYLFLIIFLVSLYLRQLKLNNIKYERRLFFNLILLIVGSSFGAPIFTINRASLIVWIFLCMLLMEIKKINREVIL